MLLVLVGDFREDEALRLLERHHGALPQRPVARTAPWREPRQSEERRLTFSSEHVEQAELLVAYQAVPQRHRDLPTLGVLGPILAGRLRERLIDRERMAQEVRWELKPDRHAGLLLARITLGEDTAPQEAEPPFSEVVAALAQAPPGADELARARTAAETAFWHALTTADGRAGALARYELLAGDHRRLFQHADAIARVTARQVRRAAERYLQPAGRSIILVEPPGGAPNTDTAAAP
jgi:predicted Zn-dependent peptidase